MLKGQAASNKKKMSLGRSFMDSQAGFLKTLFIIGSEHFIPVLAFLAGGYSLVEHLGHVS